MYYNLGHYGELQKRLRQDPVLRRILKPSEREEFVRGLAAFAGRQVSDHELEIYLGRLRRDTGDHFSPEEVRHLRQTLLGH